MASSRRRNRKMPTPATEESAQTVTNYNGIKESEIRPEAPSATQKENGVPTLDSSSNLNTCESSSPSISSPRVSKKLFPADTSPVPELSLEAAPQEGNISSLAESTADVPLQNYISNLSPQNPDAALYDARLDKIEKATIANPSARIFSRNDTKHKGLVLFSSAYTNYKSFAEALNRQEQKKQEWYPLSLRKAT
jgi:hypothetical protein